MDIIKILNEIGLTQNEASIYLTSIEIGDQPASIIAKRSNLNRGTTYSVIKTLLKKGLIVQTKKTLGTYFHAKDPNYILKYLDEKKNQIEDKKEFLSSHIQEILAKKSSIDSSRPQTTFYEGIEGIKQIHEDILSSEKGDTILSFIPQNMAEGELENYVLKDFVKKRTEKGIYSKVIIPESLKSQKIKDEDLKFLRETKIVKNENFNFESEITVYKKNIAMISYKANEMIGLIVESPSMSSTMKQIFFLTWNLSQDFIPSQEGLF